MDLANLMEAWTFAQSINLREANKGLGSPSHPRYEVWRLPVPETMVVLLSSQAAWEPEREAIFLGQLTAELTLIVTAPEYRISVLVG